MIVHTFGPALGSIDLSPFVVKLLAWLRMAGLSCTTQVSDLRKMPSRKLPAITLDDGRLMGDSQRIIDHLGHLHHDPLGEAQWSAADRAAARAWRALFESDLYFAGLYLRWVPEANWALLQPELARSLGQIGIPGLVLPVLTRVVRRSVLAQLQAQGTGRMGAEQVAENATGSYEAVAQFLADKPFMLGERPSALDATAFGFLHTLLATPFKSPMRDCVTSQANLVAYHQRMLARYWPERLQPSA